MRSFTSCLAVLPTVLLPLLAALPARADSTWVDHYRAGLAAHAAGDIAGFRAKIMVVRDVLGEQPGINYNLACAAARLGERDEALRRLRLYEASGLVRDVKADSDFVALRGDPDFERIAAQIEANGDSIGSARVHHRFADASLLTEDVAYDRETRCFFVSSIHHARVVEVAADGAERGLVDLEARPGWGVFALGVDAPRRLLWTSVAATPTAIGYQPADSGRTGLVAWDLRTRRPVRRVEWPRDGRRRLLGDLAVGPDGSIYVSDSPAGAVRVLRPGADTLATLVPDGGLDGPQTPALAPGGRQLYVADYSRGIAVVDLGTGRLSWLSFAPGIGLQGIDGLYTHGRDLIAVQNGTRPARVMRFRVDPALGRVVGGVPIETGTTRLGEPTHGVIVGDDFYFLANTGWDRVGDDQRLVSGPARPAALLKARLGP